MTDLQRNRLMAEQREIRHHLEAVRAELARSVWERDQVARDVAGNISYLLDRIDAQLDYTAEAFGLAIYRLGPHREPRRTAEAPGTEATDDPTKPR